MSQIKKYRTMSEAEDIQEGLLESDLMQIGRKIAIL